jgi:AcrR family transcriptional regulator
MEGSLRFRYPVSMTPPSSTGQRPALRRDAERNRERLLDAARQAFAELGLEAPLEEIARRADVGIATLYRRFPTRSSLIEALFVDQAEAYVRASEAALAADDAWEGFAQFVERICEMQAEDRGFTDVLTATFPSAPDLEARRAEAKANAERLIERARRQGTLRDDFVVGDLIWILLANGAYLQATRDIAPDAWRRYLALILEAARADGAGRLPPPASETQLAQALSRLGQRCGGA